MSEGGVFLGRDCLSIDGERLKKFDRIMRLSMIFMMFSAYFGLRWRSCEIDIGGCEVYIGAAAFFLALALHFTYIRPNLALAAGMALICEAVTAPFATTSFTYMATALGGADKTTFIASLDSWLGFDWLAYKDIVMRAPLLKEVSLTAYISFQIQYVTVPMLLFLCGRPAQARLFINCFILGLIPVTVIATLVPTVDALLWYKQFPLDSNGYTGFNVIDHFLMMRDGTMTRLRLSEMAGILTFPSFHAVAACLFVGFSTFLGPARFSFLGLNALMLMATPAWGGHYLTDVVAGIALGVGLIAAAQAYTRRRPKPGQTDGLP